MKRCISVLILLAVFTGAVSAQSAFGLKGAWGSSAYRGSGFEESGLEAYYDLDSFSGGVFFDWHFSKVVSLQPEVIFSRVSHNTDAEDFNRYVKRNFLEVPVYLKLSLPLGRTRFYIMGGPDFMLPIGDVMMESLWEFNGQRNISASDYYDNTFLLGAAAGLGFEFPLGPGFLVTGLKYSTNLTSYFDGGDVFNQSFLFEVGYGFGKR